MRRWALALVLAVAPLACAQGQAVDDGGGSGGVGGSGGSGGFNGSGGAGGGSPDARPRPDASDPMDAPPMMVDAPANMQPDAAMPDAPPPQGPCGSVTVTPITIPFDVTMTTSGGTDTFHVTGSANDLLTNCLDGDGTGSADKVFQLTLATTSTVTISVAHPTTTFPVVLYVRNADCRSYAGCEGRFVGADPQPTLVGNNVAAGTYFVIVDGFNASGTFRLTVTSP